MFGDARNNFTDLFMQLKRQFKPRNPRNGIRTPLIEPATRCFVPPDANMREGEKEHCSSLVPQGSIDRHNIFKNYLILLRILKNNLRKKFTEICQKLIP